MERLLILEDDLALGEGVRLALQGDDRPVTLCRTLAQARQALGGGRALCPADPGCEPPRRQRPVPAGRGQGAGAGDPPHRQ